jgi:peptide-methionine (S)-S-oxide reductase
MSSLVVLAGCFWSTESVLSRIPGIVTTTAGYAGGQVGNVLPTYYNLDISGHSEAVLVEYDADVTWLEDIVLAIIEKSQNDPSPAFCSRYRRAFLCSTSEQMNAIYRLLPDWDLAVGFEFYPAEAYHQGYYARVLGI